MDLRLTQQRASESPSALNANSQSVVQRSLDAVNARPGLLDGFRLEHTVVKIGCSALTDAASGVAALAIQAKDDRLQRGTTSSALRFVGAIGPRCSASEVLLPALSNELRLFGISGTPHIYVYARE